MATKIVRFFYSDGRVLMCIAVVEVIFSFFIIFSNMHDSSV